MASSSDSFSSALSHALEQLDLKNSEVHRGGTPRKFCVLYFLALKVDQLKNYRPLVKGVGLAIVNPHVMGRATDPSGGEPNVLCPSSGGGASYMQLAGAEHAPGGGAIYLQPMWEEPNVFLEVGLTISNPCGRSLVASYRPFPRSFLFFFFFFVLLLVFL